jgi:hypothetical protein
MHRLFYGEITLVQELDREISLAELDVGKEEGLRAALGYGRA